jgi:uncharacterized protein (DUF1501 family)
MTSTKKDPVLVVLQLTGGNDGLNTLVPYGDPLYVDQRPTMGIPIDQVLPIDDYVGFNPNMAPLKRMYDEGKVAVIQGIGYPQPSRSHFRSMDIWHTCESEKVGIDGWLGRALRDIDPRHENVLTGVNFGRGLPRSVVAADVPVASVGMLETYGVLTSIEEEDRSQALDIFARMYAPAIGRSAVEGYISQTGMDALKGADILRVAPELYSSSVEYGSDTVSQYMRNIAQVHLAGLGTRIFYNSAPYNSFDTHANQMSAHATLWSQVSQAVSDFFQDLKDHQVSKDVLILAFSEFGRRVKDNGTGTDHGAAGVAFVIGENVKGGLYGEYPSLETGKLVEGDLYFNNDFRSTYTAVTEDWMSLDPISVVGGNFEKMDILS